MLATFRNIFIDILLCLPLWLCAQENKPGAGFGIDANFFAGHVLRHTPKFHLPLPDVSTGMDVNFVWKMYGKKPWQQRRKYPTVGIAVAYTNYGIDSVYGRCFSIYPNITIPIISGKKLEWTIRIGDGAGYVTHHYSRVPFDTANNAISTHLNDYASFMTDLRYHINNHWDVQLGANFSHISNAATQQPNLGINLYGAHIGIRYFPVTSAPQRIIQKIQPLSNRWLYELRLTTARTGANAPLGPSYPVYVVSAYASRRWKSKNKYFGGIDYSYHSDIAAYLKANSFVSPGTEAAHSYKSAIFGGNEFLLGRVGVVLQVGVYIHQAFLTQALYYEKIGGNLYLVQREHGPIKELFLCGFLKTHLSVAELAEFGCGVGF